ncbi:MAG: hypothetical protein QMC80_02425 [Thermoplasmatales archaeon]|nr:hypothetical protein [Thermoplasmatales archaeon]
MKPGVGIFGFTGCAGCQLEILNLEDILLDLPSVVDIINFRMAKSENLDGPLDISFVEGSIMKYQVGELKKIRKNSKILVAIGSCACYGGVQYLQNFIEKPWKIVYNDKKMKYASPDTKSLSSYVKVDYSLPGCPIDKEEFVDFLKSVLLGRKPKMKSYPICVECKLRENDCLLEKGTICLGPVTVAGCNSKCPNNNYACEGCRGPVEEANISSQAELMKEKGIDPVDLIRRFRMFTSGAKEFQEAKA